MAVPRWVSGSSAHHGQPHCSDHRQNTDAVYADLKFYGSEVLALDGAKCNARITTGCRQEPKVVPVGDTAEYSREPPRCRHH